MRTHWKLLISVLILLPAVYGSFYLYRKYRMPPGLFLEKINLTDFSNQSKPLLDHIRAYTFPTIVLFGQSWCPDCHHELMKIHSMKKKNFPNVNVLVLSDEKMSFIKKWRATRGLDFPFFQVKPSLEALKVFAYPTTYIVSNNGEVLYSKVGRIDWENSEALALFKQNKN